MELQILGTNQRDQEIDQQGGRERATDEVGGIHLRVSRAAQPFTRAMIAATKRPKQPKKARSNGISQSGSSRRTVRDGTENRGRDASYGYKNSVKTRSVLSMSADDTSRCVTSRVRCVTVARMPWL